MLEPEREELTGTLMRRMWSIDGHTSAIVRRSIVPDIGSYIAKHDNKSACKLGPILACGTKRRKFGAATAPQQTGSPIARLEI